MAEEMRKMQVARCKSNFWTKTGLKSRRCRSASGGSGQHLWRQDDTQDSLDALWLLCTGLGLWATPKTHSPTRSCIATSGTYFSPRHRVMYSPPALYIPHERIQSVFAPPACHASSGDLVEHVRSDPGQKFKYDAHIFSHIHLCNAPCSPQHPSCTLVVLCP